ncbi:MAG: YgiQ family radical SAM protein [Kiritimatiellaeota bacterium]|nr:YgiQ family radical SAM protein [Kiritimatiellota bacterium]
MTRQEMAERGWEELDVLLIGGDAYVDHPSFGIALIGRVLEAEGCRVGVITQPDWRDPASVARLGRPRLFCGVTAGNLDSMLANYTVARRKRRKDDYSEGGRPGRRPNYACVVYTQLVRRAFPGLPVLLGGIEASLRRVAHYDYWQDRIRASILADAKADLLVYGMGERAVREVLRRAIARDFDWNGIPGTARLLKARETEAADFANAVELPSVADCRQDPVELLHLTKAVEAEQNPWCGRRLVQMHGNRALVLEPPARPLSTPELDQLYALPFSRRPHPLYTEPIPAWAMIRDSITAVRGCSGGCTFCGLGLHQGRFITSRSRQSVLAEIESLADSADFRGTVSDVGGPTANLYGCRNGTTPACRRCRRPSCLHPRICPHFEIDERSAIELLGAARRVPGVRHVFINSGIRLDVILRTPHLLRALVRHHVSGHLKVAPEHLHPNVLRRMRKSSARDFHLFRERFEAESRAAGKEQYLVPYFISNFPGCTDREMDAVGEFLRSQGWRLQQVQDFIPLPMTPAAAMYYAGRDYDTERPIPVARGLAERRRQMRILGRKFRERGPRNAR